ncbi:kinetochore protein Spc24 [Electrophorus electricus]|uniref:Kinetochore protein Spc24 n=1 Tax=Electrophorus electricus TaxID=8005 RepID=A0A4W4EVV5_ELEEL|nr:kinetochore protein Spc24 [Electrophorus electricus]XP_026859124.1 kinetochore protein Spc24 [Electrophorus electricus]XP_026859125.1 kinetochore protein Spc24 [Electrophorus electricus]XP_026859126.1 kinetochore protein Spc24 [Electrophorus electricus]XP_035379465.1 kinetochore protein Spc24 [Electrophorus electricus]
MLQNDALDHDLENTGEMVIKLIESSKAEDALRAARKKQQALFDHHLETKKIVTQLLNSLVHSEEVVGQKLLDLEGQKTQMTRELYKVDQEVQQSLAKSLTLDSEMEFLQKELEKLKESEKEIQSLQQEVDEDTTEVIPSAIYLAQLYLKVTGIKLELDTEPHILRGVHYGADVATPINIDTSTRSTCETSDELWSLVNTDW